MPKRGDSSPEFEPDPEEPKFEFIIVDSMFTAPT